MGPSWRPSSSSAGCEPLDSRPAWSQIWLSLTPSSHAQLIQPQQLQAKALVCGNERALLLWLSHGFASGHQENQCHKGGRHMLHACAYRRWTGCLTCQDGGQGEVGGHIVVQHAPARVRRQRGPRAPSRRRRPPGTRRKPPPSRARLHASAASAHAQMRRPHGGTAPNAAPNVPPTVCNRPSHGRQTSPKRTRRVFGLCSLEPVQHASRDSHASLGSTNIRGGTP